MTGVTIGPDPSQQRDEHDELRDVQRVVQRAGVEPGLLELAREGREHAGRSSGDGANRRHAAAPAPLDVGYVVADDGCDAE